MVNLTDPIADMLTRIRNSCLSGGREIVLPDSNLRRELANQLKVCGFLSEVKVFKEGSIKQLRLSFAPRLEAKTLVKRLSRPGRRLYRGVAELNSFYHRGREILIVSTSKGLMTAEAAEKKKLGGELICLIS